VSARAEHDDALVLRSVDYGEADRIVTLLTRRHGKLAALARSARRSKRRFAGALEGFALLDAELAIGTGDLARLQSARVTRAFPRLLGDLERLSAAGALLRLTRDLVPEHVPDPDLFDALLGMFEALERADVPPAPLHIAFEIRLLALTGFAPLLAACGRCGKRPAAGRAADFDAMRGSVICQACGGAGQRLHGTVRSRLIAAMDGEVIEVAQSTWSQEQLGEARHLLDEFVAHRLQRQPER
jgi:DNA repair protein RecO (recombination protein O)